MRSYSLLLLVSVLEGVVCDDSFGMKLTTESMKIANSTQYRFHYYVKDDKTGDYKTQEEIKEGDSVQGSYTLADPNGDLRTVTYRAGPGKGFEAKVNVHPSGSSLKQTTIDNTPTESSSTSSSVIKTTRKTEKSTAMESKVKNFPGGFTVDILSKPQSSVKTEMGMKFSLKTNSISPPVTNLSTTIAAVGITATEKPETTQEITLTTYKTLKSSNLESSSVHNSTFPTEGREINEDSIEKELDEAINSMPKLPELVLSDNKTHFKFHKDPEEALLDERITQIARQLAETSLRREYEERKLGHFIPISVSPIVPGSSSYLSKSLKFTRNDSPDFRPSEPNSFHILSQLKVVPHYVYKQTLIPKISPLNYRLPIVSRPFENTKQWEQQTDETITNTPDILKINKFENKSKEIKKTFKENEKNSNLNYKTTETLPISVMPLHVPTFFQFFSPYVVHTSKSYVTPQQPVSQSITSTVKKDITTREVLPNDDKTLYSYVPMLYDHNTEKP